MYSIAFPKMFSPSRTLLVEDHEATVSNLKLLLESERTSLFGDPYFGVLIKRFIYEKNNTILRDLVIDEIFTSIITFIPQLRLERKDIVVKQVKDDIYAEIIATNVIDYQTDMYSIKLTSTDEVTT